MRICEEQANKEVKNLADGDKSTPMDLTKTMSRRTFVDEFSWERPLNTVITHLPTLFHVLSGTLTNNRHRDEVRM